MIAGQTMWLLVLTIGVVILAGAVIYGIMRNRQRTVTEQVVTDVATKQEYAREDRDTR